jgi:hypothetical protein
VLLFRPGRAAQRAADTDADLLRSLLSQIQMGVVDRLPGRRDRELRAAIEALERLAFQIVGRMEVEDFGGDATGQRARIEVRDRTDGGARAANALPEPGSAAADRGDRADTRDDDAPILVCSLRSDLKRPLLSP